MKKVILLISFVLVAISSILAQKNQDFIISLTKDTVFGKVLFSDDSYLVFKHRRKKLHFKSASIGKFGIYKKGEYLVYKSITNANGATAIVRVINNGKLKLYEYKKRQQNFSKDNYYMIGLSDQKLVTLSYTTFDKAISGFLQNEPNLLAQVASTKYHQIPELIAAYNQLNLSDNLASLNQIIGAR